MNQSNINDTLMDTDDNIHEVYNGTEAANTYDGERWLYYNTLIVSSWLIFTIGLVLMSVAIVAVSSLVKKDNVAPIFVINLLVSDVIQLCSMIIVLTGRSRTVMFIGGSMQIFGLSASVGFMVCIALERYLVIVWPLWYQTRRTVKMSLLLCAAVWTLALVLVFVYKWDPYVEGTLVRTIFGIFFLLPFPVLVVLLVGTLSALSACISVRAEEKRRIVRLLVLLLIYTLLSLPRIILFLVHPYDIKLLVVAIIFNRLNPIADLFMYIFLRKGAVNQVWFCLCCCRKNRTSRQSSSGLNDCDTVTGS